MIRINASPKVDEKNSCSILLKSEHINDKIKTKIPITEIVNTEERYCYGSDNENDNEEKETKVSANQKSGVSHAAVTNETPPTGVMGKTGQLIGSVRSSLWSGASGVVSFGFGAISAGVSVGTGVVSSVASGVANLVPKRTSSTTVTASSITDATEQTAETFSPKPPGIVAKVLFRTQKSKAE